MEDASAIPLGALAIERWSANYVELHSHLADLTQLQERAENSVRKANSFGVSLPELPRQARRMFDDLKYYPKTHIVVIGHNNCGKSTFINALLGMGTEIVSASIQTETGRVCILSFAPTPSDCCIKLWHKNSYARPFAEPYEVISCPTFDPLDPAEAGYARFRLETKRPAFGIAQWVDTIVELCVDSPLLSNGLSIVDMPGFARTSLQSGQDDELLFFSSAVDFAATLHSPLFVFLYDNATFTTNETNTYYSWLDRMASSMRQAPTTTSSTSRASAHVSATSVPSMSSLPIFYIKTKLKPNTGYTWKQLFATIDSQYEEIYANMKEVLPKMPASPTQAPFACVNALDALQSPDHDIHQVFVYCFDKLMAWVVANHKRRIQNVVLRLQGLAWTYYNSLHATNSLISHHREKSLYNVSTSTMNAISDAVLRITKQHFEPFPARLSQLFVDTDSLRKELYATQRNVFLDYYSRDTDVKENLNDLVLVIFTKITPICGRVFTAEITSLLSAWEHDIKTAFDIYWNQQNPLLMGAIQNVLLDAATSAASSNDDSRANMGSSALFAPLLYRLLCSQIRSEAELHADLATYRMAFNRDFDFAKLVRPPPDGDWASPEHVNYIISMVFVELLNRIKTNPIIMQLNQSASAASSALLAAVTAHFQVSDSHTTTTFATKHKGSAPAMRATIHASSTSSPARARSPLSASTGLIFDHLRLTFGTVAFQCVQLSGIIDNGVNLDDFGPIERPQSKQPSVPHSTSGTTDASKRDTSEAKRSTIEAMSSHEELPLLTLEQLKAFLDEVSHSLYHPPPRSSSPLSSASDAAPDTIGPVSTNLGHQTATTSHSNSSTEGRHPRLASTVSRQLSKQVWMSSQVAQAIGRAKSNRHYRMLAHGDPAVRWRLAFPTGSQR